MLIDIEELPIESVGPIELENHENYPYYQLLVSLVSEGMKKPLIFKDDHGKLECIEGRHRFQILTLLYKTDPNYFNKVIGKVEVLMCETPPEMCESPNGIDSSWLNMITRLKGIYAKFLYTK